MARQSAYRRRIKIGSPSVGLADIGIMALVMFLSMTVMDPYEYGINMKLAPWADEVLEIKPSEMPHINFIDINCCNQLMIADEIIELKELRIACKTIMLKDLHDVNYSISRIRVNRSATYKAYIYVLNEVVAAKNEILNQAARKRYNLEYKRLDFGQRRSLHRQYPIVIEDIEYSTPYQGYIPFC